MSRNALTTVSPLALLALSTLLSVGCVNLDKQTTVTKSPMKKTPEAMLKETKSTGDSFVKRVRRALPKRKVKHQIADAPVSKDDPTRLENETEVVGPQLYIAAARMSEQHGRPDVALQQYNKALTIDGRNRNALIGMARLQHKTGNSTAAIRVYRDALNIYRDDAVIMNDLGLCYARNGQINESISMLQAATRTAPDRPMYVNNLAAALVEANRANEAASYLSQAHGPAQANYQVGYLLDRAGRRGEATNYLQQALAINPNLQSARELLEQSMPQVSSLPNDLPRTSDYSIPVSQAGPMSTLQAPTESYRAPGTIEAAAPGQAPTHLENKKHRFGPFGFVPQPELNKVQVVSYVEDAE